MDNGLSNLPPGVVTAVGSLPLTDPSAAVDLLAARCPTLPAWPQLPQRNAAEGMIEQALLPMRGMLTRHPTGCGYRVRDGALGDLLATLHKAPARLIRESAAGFYAFADALEVGRFSGAAAVKGQLVGPLTLAMCLTRGEADRPFIDHPALVEAVGAYLGRLAAGQVRRLSESSGKPVIVSVDEPVLGSELPGADAGALGQRHEAVNAVLRAIDEAGGISAVHCCGGDAVEQLDHVRPDIFSFDACRHLSTFTESPAARRFLDRGGRVAFGLVPTVDRPASINPRTLFMQWLHTAIRLQQIPRLARQSLVTATCGLGLLDERAASESFRAADQIRELIATAADRPPVPRFRLRV